MLDKKKLIRQQCPVISLKVHASNLFKQIHFKYSKIPSYINTVTITLGLSVEEIWNKATNRIWPDVVESRTHPHTD